MIGVCIYCSLDCCTARVHENELCTYSIVLLPHFDNKHHLLCFIVVATFVSFCRCTAALLQQALMWVSGVLQTFSMVPMLLRGARLTWTGFLLVFFVGMFKLPPPPLWFGGFSFGEQVFSRSGWTGRGPGIHRGGTAFVVFFFRLLIGRVQRASR